MSEPKWHIRPAQDSDAEQVTECMHAAYRPYLERLEGAYLPPLDTDYQSDIKLYPAWVIEQAQPAESDTSILGALFMDFTKEKAFLANIALRPNCQGLGLGSALITFAEQETRKRGFSELHLATHRLLNENLSLYQHLGWQEIERDEQKVVMKKTLPKTD